MYDEGKNMWSLKVVESNVTATSKAPHASYTLGKYNWTITGDDGCNRGKTYETELKMSGCQDGEFTCHDGQCIRAGVSCVSFPFIMQIANAVEIGDCIAEQFFGPDLPF